MTQPNDQRIAQELPTDVKPEPKLWHTPVLTRFEQGDAEFNPLHHLHPNFAS